MVLRHFLYSGAKSFASLMADLHHEILIFPSLRSSVNGALRSVNQETSEKSAEISILWLPEKTNTMWFWLFWKFLLEVSTLVATILRFQLIFQTSPDSLLWVNVSLTFFSYLQLQIFELGNKMFWRILFFSRQYGLP